MNDFWQFYLIINGFILLCMIFAVTGEKTDDFTHGFWFPYMYDAMEERHFPKWMIRIFQLLFFVVFCGAVLAYFALGAMLVIVLGLASFLYRKRKK